MNALASALLVILTVHVRADLTPVYARHMRQHPLGAEGRAVELAEQLERAARLADVDVSLLAALAADESAVDHARTSSEGALGALQLLPASPWGKGWQEACRRARRGRRTAPETEVERLNAQWGAFALRDGLVACRGHRGLALGFYRSGKCVEGPRARHTLALARWLENATKAGG
jgi:hypothetical protein